MVTEVVHKMSAGETFATTPADFAFFKKRCRYYLERFGLMDWAVSIVHVSLETNTAAECQRDFIKRWGVIRLNKTVTWPVTRESLDRTAMHECAHLLLAPFSGLIAEMHDGKLVTMEQAESAEEAIVRTLESFVFNGPINSIAVEV